MNLLCFMYPNQSVYIKWSSGPDMKWLYSDGHEISIITQGELQVDLRTVLSATLSIQEQRIGATAQITLRYCATPVRQGRHVATQQGVAIDFNKGRCVLLLQPQDWCPHHISNRAPPHCFPSRSQEKGLTSSLHC
jgi:hypothetical protein